MVSSAASAGVSASAVLGAALVSVVSLCGRLTVGAGLVQAVLAEQRMAAVGGERDAWQEQCEELTQKLECTQEALKEVTAEREALAGDVEDYEAKVRAGHDAWLSWRLSFIEADACCTLCVQCTYRYLAAPINRWRGELFLDVEAMTGRVRRVCDGDVRAVQIDELCMHIKGLEADLEARDDELDAERCAVARLQETAASAAAEAETARASEAGERARAGAAEADAAEQRTAVVAAAAERERLSVSLEVQQREHGAVREALQDAREFVGDHLRQSWLTAMRAMPKTAASAVEGASARGPLAVLSENAPPDSPVHAAYAASPPATNSASPIGGSSPLRQASAVGSSGVGDGGTPKPQTPLRSTPASALFGGAGAAGAVHKSPSSASVPGSYREFEDAAVGGAEGERGCPAAWRELAAAIESLHAEALCAQGRQLEGVRAIAAQEVALVKSECAKVRLCQVPQLYDNSAFRPCDTACSLVSSGVAPYAHPHIGC